MSIICARENTGRRLRRFLLARSQVFAVWSRLLSRGSITVYTDAELADPTVDAALPFAPPCFVFNVEAASNIGVYREMVVRLECAARALARALSPSSRLSLSLSVARPSSRRPPLL